MPYKPVVNDILEMTIACQQNGQVSENKIHWKTSAVTTGGATLTEIATAMDTALAALVKAMIANTASYRGIGFQKIFPTPRVTLEYSAASAGVGTGGATPLPTQVAGLVSTQTANAGRAYRGRMYLPFPSTAFSGAAGHPTAGYLTAIANLTTAIAFSQTIVGIGGTTTMVLVVYHAKAGAGGIPAAHTSDQVVSYSDRAEWATQRRRGDYGRLNNLPF